MERFIRICAVHAVFITAYTRPNTKCQTGRLSSVDWSSMDRNADLPRLSIEQRGFTSLSIESHPVDGEKSNLDLRVRVSE